MKDETKALKHICDTAERHLDLAAGLAAKANTELIMAGKDYLEALLALAADGVKGRKLK